MNPLDFLGMAAFYAPFLAIGLVVAHNRLRRAIWARSKRLHRPDPGLCPAIVSVGTPFRHLEIFYRPSMAYVLEAEEGDDADEDSGSDPETPSAHFRRQLRRIRRGEQVDTLVLRL
jgi:hypothetical protein